MAEYGIILALIAAAQILQRSALKTGKLDADKPEKPSPEETPAALIAGET